MKRSPTLAALLALSVALFPSMAMAQGFEFGEDEVEEVDEVDEGGEDIDTQDPAGLDFSEDDVETTTYSGAEPSQVAVVAVSGPAMDSDRRAKIQAELERATSEIPNITMLGGSSILGALEASGGEACVAEPLCLADVGEQAGVERILVASVIEKPDGLELKIDYFDVDDKLFIKYENTGGIGGTPGLVRAVEPSVKSIFDVREMRAKQGLTGDEDTSTVQTVLAFGTAGLAVASLVGGIVFGLGAKSIEREVEGRPKNGDGVYEMTQVEARDAIRPAETKATTANVFYGLAIGLAAVSGLLFYIRGGSDVAEDQEASRPRHRDLQIAPAVSADGVGFGASLRF